MDGDENKARGFEDLVFDGGTLRVSVVSDHEGELALRLQAHPRGGLAQPYFEMPLSALGSLVDAAVMLAARRVSEKA